MVPSQYSSRKNHGHPLFGRFTENVFPRFPRVWDIVMRLAASVIMIFFDAFAIITASIYPITPF
jgi:hypothetical protein